MKENLHSACLLLIFSLFFIAGLAGLGNASEDPDPYNFSNFEKNETVTWGKIGSPISDYKIWGYPGKDYNFTTTYNNSLFSNNTTMVFYWDCKGHKSDHTAPAPMSDAGRLTGTHNWSNPGTYYVSVGVFQDNRFANFSYWVPVNVENNTTIIVQNISMLEGNEGVDCSNNVNKDPRLDNSENSDKYCGYVKNDYSFSVTLNASCLTDVDNRTIFETTTVVGWDDESWDTSSMHYTNMTDISSISGFKSYNNSCALFNKNFTHEWHKTGKKNISVRAFHWDPLDGEEVYTNYTNTSILIIRDPKNFIPLPIFSNLQNWGILLSITGLIILFFTYTKNNVPVKISFLGLKPFYLRPVNSLKGTFMLVAGMYLYFVFGRAPWDIPIVRGVRYAFESVL
ncbi:TPA: hypothetical protein HA351_13210 [Methanosarcinaceae archaeon]|nr:hypothetical protein [Methanosarcinaceae archaeon]